MLLCDWLRSCKAAKGSHVGATEETARDWALLPQSSDMAVVHGDLPEQSSYSQTLAISAS